MRENFTLKGKDKGFALIATITLMVLLALLSVGLLTIASSQTRVSQRGIFAAEARAQAKLALEVAIGRLQCELGPDQRISANSGILDTNPNSEQIEGVANPYILGVWDSWGTWMNRKNSEGLSLADTYSKGRKELFRSWLISSPLQQNTRDMDTGTKDLGQFRGSGGESKVQLLGSGTLGRQADRDKQIYAGLVQVDDASTPTGPVKGKKSLYKKSIAWWVSGENQKIRINLPNNQQGTDELSVLRSTWTTPSPDVAQIDGLSSIFRALPSEGSSDYKRKLKSWITRDTMSMLSRDAGGNPSYHDVSLDATSLLADVKFGGLKKDMNILFSQEELPDTFRSSESDLGLRPYTMEDGSPVESTRPIGSWNQLYEWSNIWDTSGKLRNGQDRSARLQWEGSLPYSLIASDEEPVENMMNNRYTYIRHPILLKMYSFVGLIYNNREASYTGYRGGAIDSLYAVIPVFVWWNPYNVTLRMEGAKGEFWGAHFGEHRFMPMSLSTNDNGSTTDDAQLNKYGENVLTPYNNHAYNNRQICDFGASFRKTSTIKGSDGNSTLEKGETSVLKPGEIVIYAQPIAPGKTGYISKIKEGDRDAEVDNLPLKESWDQSYFQIRAYGVHVQDGIKYEQLTGSEFQDVPYKRKSNVIFAETSDSSYIDFTPDNVILPFKYTEEYTTQNKKLGAYVMAAGMMDFDEIKKQGKPQRISKRNGGNGNDPRPYTKMMPAMFNMNWGAWEEKVIDTVMYPQEMWDNSTADNKRTGRGGTAKPEATFVAYFGISAKWGRSPAVGTYPKGKDYRAKTWQHSSPLFWGSQMIKASELGRTYSPYQFELKQGTNTDTLSIANVMDNEGSRASIFGGPGSESISMIVAAELPFYPPNSIAGFAGCRLTPGWYSAGDSSTAQIAKRFAYQSGVPGVGIGNSFADPMLPGNVVFSSNPVMNDEKLGDFWDHGLMANDGVWDSWFTSSLSSQPSSLRGGGKVSLESVIKSSFDIAMGSEKGDSDKEVAPFANANLSLDLNGESSDNAINDLKDTRKGWEKASKYLRLQGGFNVNSVSYPAWRSLLQGLKGRSILYLDNNGAPQILQGDKKTAYFSRMAVAVSNVSHVDDFGAVGVNNGAPIGENTAWTDLRKVDERSLDNLTKSMLAQVKRRGPFLNMAEFINRRLTVDDMGVKGALQTAIDESGLNSVFDSMRDKHISPQVSYPFPKAAEGSIYTAAPGYLIQSDILSVLGNVLVMRDDTFTIRAYGEVADRGGKSILSRAWCEAVVKRDIDYVDPINSPETPMMVVNEQTGELSENNKLSKINKAFGRKFEVVSFRWLAPEEI